MVKGKAWQILDADAEAVLMSAKKRIFISSVQKELELERAAWLV